MRVRTLLLAAVAALTGTVSVPAEAAVVPFPAMGVITVSGSYIPGRPPETTVTAELPAGWTCYQQWLPESVTFDATCIPPAAPPGMQNVCLWTASGTAPVGATVVIYPGAATPTTSSSCGGVTAVSGGSRPSVGVAPSGQVLNSLRCRVSFVNVPPEAPFTATCNSNH